MRKTGHKLSVHIPLAKSSVVRIQEKMKTDKV